MDDYNVYLSESEDVVRGGCASPCTGGCGIVCGLSCFATGGGAVAVAVALATGASSAGGIIA